MKLVRETIYYKQTVLASQQKEESVSREEEWQWSAVSMIPMSLKSRILNF